MVFVTRSSTSHPSIYHVLVDSLQVISPSDVVEEVDKTSGDVVLDSVFAGGIIPRECVVVVMEPFSDGGKLDETVFGRVDVNVVGFVPKHVGETVDHEGAVKGPNVSQHARHEESVPKGFTPYVTGNNCRQNDATDGNQVVVVSTKVQRINVSFFRSDLIRKKRDPRGNEEGNFPSSTFLRTLHGASLRNYSTLRRLAAVS